MTERVVDITAAGAFLRSRNGLLVIEVGGREVETIPFADLAAVVVANQQACFTQGVLAGLAEAGASLIACDTKHHPAAMMVPLEGHWAQAERLRAQAAIGTVQKKRWWQAVVRAKIESQGYLLGRLYGTDYGLSAMGKRVASGDTGNVESQAARRYWMVVFGDTAFRRGNEDDTRNALLNYGYAVLRATVARAICATGMHPSFGLHHRSKVNAFGLADDLMEPYRPMVDRAVVDYCRGAEPPKLTAEAKQKLIEAVTGRYRVENESRTLSDVLVRMTQSLAGAIAAGDLRWKPARWEFES